MAFTFQIDYRNDFTVHFATFKLFHAYSHAHPSPPAAANCHSAG